MTPTDPSPGARLTLATKLTLGRIVLALVLAPAILTLPPLVGAAILVLTAVTDYLDGAVARARNEVSALGAALDPIADKLVAVSALIAFVAAGTLTGPHLIPVLGILLRETLIAGLREAAAGSGTLAVSRLAKWKTAVQFAAFILLCFGATPLALGLLWAAAALTVWTGGAYLLKWWASAR